MLKLRSFCQLFLIAMLTGLVFAQSGSDVTLDAELSRARAYVGDVVTYQVLVRGADDGSPPEVDFPPSVRAEYLGASSQKFTTMRSVNGRQRAYTDAYYKHQYQLMIIDEGDITIPGAALEINGRRYLSNAARITGLLPQYSAKDIVEIELPSRPIYVGESVVARVSWWIGDSQTSGTNFNSSTFPDSMRVVPMTPRGISGEEHSISLMGQNIISYLDRSVYQGISMMRLRFDLVLTPTQAGELELGPVRVVFTRQDGFSRSTRMYGESRIHPISVIDVPTAGMPAGYRGMIGSYQVQSDASNTQVNVGDPIDVRVLVSGTDPMLGLEQTLDVQALASKGFRVSPEGWKELERRRNGERLFSTTVRALDGSVQEVPAIELPAFNPETGEFEVFASQPIPIKVRAVRSVTLSDAVISSLPTDGGTELERGLLERNPSVFWAHPDAAEIRGSARSFTLARVISEPMWVAVLASIVGLPMIAWAIRRFVLSSDPRGVAIQKAWRQASRLHSKGQDVEAIRVYAGAILEIEPESFTGSDLKKLGISEELIERSSVVLSGEEGKHFGRTNESKADGSLLRAIRHDVRHRGLNKARGRASV
jgi:oxygen tolerance protein BatD